MLLSIDRVLQLLAEGKSLEKISELSEVAVADISQIIEDGRTLLRKYEKVKTKRKIIIKKNKDSKVEPVNDEFFDKILSRGEFNAIPYEDGLVMILSIASLEGDNAVGIIIEDSTGKQVGKIPFYVKKKSIVASELFALEKAILIGDYFKARSLKLRIDDEKLVSQINKGDAFEDGVLEKLHKDLKLKLENSNDVKVEFISKAYTEKAQFIASRYLENKNNNYDKHPKKK